MTGGLSYQVAPDKVSKDVLDESSTLRQTRKGKRVEARKEGRPRTEYFPATVVGDVGDGREVYVCYDDVVGDVKVMIEDTRALMEIPSYPNKNFRLKISNVDEFEHQVFFRAMRAGKAGLRFIAFNTEHGDKVLDADGASVSKIISDRLGADDGSTSPEERAASQELFAEILEMCPYQEFVRYQIRGSYDEIATCLQLFYCARNSSLLRMRKKESDDRELLKEKGCLTGCSSESSFNVLDGVREMIQGNYILESWRSSTDSTDAYNDVVSMNQNLGLIAALILTIAIPPGLAANGITDKSTFAEIAYLFCISVVSLTEGLAVLITTRNLIALNALEPENIKAYLSVAQSVLMIPIRLNFVAVLALFGALNMWAYAQNGSLLWLGFFFLIVVPTLIVFFHTTGAGIMHLYTVQPWRSRKKSHGESKYFCTGKANK